MTSTRRLFALALLLVLALAAPAGAAVAPGRVTFPLGKTGKRAGVDAWGLTVGVALGDGRSVLAGLEPGKGAVLVQLRADGSLDQSFGSGGIAHLSVSFNAGYVGPSPLQLLRQPDGRLILVAGGPSASKYQLRQLVFLRLTADGRLDPTFGKDGIAQPGVQASCDNCSPAALQADGSIVFTGNTGEIPATVEQTPTVKPDFHWVAGRLTSNGNLDATFGNQGIAQLPGQVGTGYGAAALPAGAVAVIGSADGGPKLARLTGTGVLDPAFHGGTPLTPATPFTFIFGVLGHATGAVDVLATKGGGGQLLRYTPAGDLDTSFGNGGVLNLEVGEGISELLAAPDGGDVVAGATTLNPSLEPVGAKITRIAANGSIAAQGTVPIPFGGGLATVFARIREPKPTPIGQTGFHATRAFARPDGGIVLPGAVSVVRYTGEGAGFRAEEAAVAAITPALALDPAFGAPMVPAKLSIRIPAQRAEAATTRRLLRVAVTATTSGPGLTRLTVKAGKRIVAQSTAGAFTTGTQRLPAFLTKVGRRYLRHAHNVRITVTATFRDFMGSQATARATGRLR